MKKLETMVSEGDTEDGDYDSEDEKVGTGTKNKEKIGRNRDILPKDEHKLFLKMRHIHRQLGHPCKRVWSKMLKEAGLWFKESSKSVDRIHKECSTCKH